VRSRQPVPLDQPFEHDRRARQRDEQPDEDCERHRGPHDDDEKERDGDCRPDNLQRTGHDNGSPDLPHRRQREIQADGEEEKDDAQFSEHLYFFGGLENPHDARPCCDAGDHQRDDRRHPSAGERHDE
jgi:hypothetical protein